MIAVDTNILIYAHREDSPKHSVAKRCLGSLADSADVWGIPVFCLGEFVRVITHRRLFNSPHTASEAGDALAKLLSLNNVTVLMPSSNFPKLLAETVRKFDSVGNLVFDAQIAALCLDCKVSALVTEDRDFDRFRGLRIERL